MGVQGVQQRTQHTALGDNNVEDKGVWCVPSRSDNLRAGRQEVQDLGTHWWIQAQVMQLSSQPAGDYSVERWTVVYEQQSDIAPSYGVKVGEVWVHDLKDGVVCGSVGAVGELQWV